MAPAQLVLDREIDRARGCQARALLHRRRAGGEAGTGTASLCDLLCPKAPARRRRRAGAVLRRRGGSRRRATGSEPGVIRGSGPCGQAALWPG